MYISTRILTLGIDTRYNQNDDMQDVTEMCV